MNTRDFRKGAARALRVVGFRLGLIIGWCSACCAISSVAADAAEVERVGRPRAILRAQEIDPGSLSPRDGQHPKSEEFRSLNVHQAIEQCVENDMEAVGAPGASVTVILDGQVIFERGFGVRRRGHPEPVTSETRFRIGSATKMFTAAAVLQQAELGLVDLDAPVTDWIPELRLGGTWPADSVTVRHLLTHSAAVPDHYEDPLALIGDGALASWAAGLDAVRLHAPPGTFWNYSNPGFSLAGLVAERASGVAFRELVQTRVFDAAGMYASTFDPAEVMASGNFAAGHPPPSSGDPTIYAPDSFDSWIGAPAGQAFSTSSDLASWAQLLMDGGGAVLAETSTVAMQRRQIDLNLEPGSHYGLGVFGETYKGLDVRQHGGNIIGWGAMLMWVPKERFVVSILDNTMLHLSAAAYCVVDAVLGPEPVPVPDYSTDPSAWAAFAGRYSFWDNRGNPFEAEVAWSVDRFTITFLDAEGAAGYQTDLVQQYPNTFIIDLDGDGVLDPLYDLTFIPRAGSGGPTRWLRNRSFVGRRVVEPRRARALRIPL